MFVLLQGRESPGKGRWGWTQLRAGINVEGEGKEEPLMEHEVDFWAGVAFLERMWMQLGLSSLSPTRW